MSKQLSQSNDGDLSFDWRASAEALLEPLAPRLLRFHLVTRGHLDLGDDAGALLRSAFGRALKAAACPDQHGRCRDRCRQSPDCMYSTLFESPVTANMRQERGVTNLPHPLVLRISSGRVRVLPPAFMFRAEALLFGPAREHAALIYESMVETGREGLGKERVGFDVASASLLDSDGRELAIEHRGSPLQLSHVQDRPRLPRPGPPEPWRAELRFLTRVRLRRHGAIMTEIDFESLVLNVVRRYRELRAAWSTSPVDWNVPEILSLARRVEIVRSELRYSGVERWSSRQKRTLPVGGLVGGIEFDGDIGPFVGLLRVGELIHIGKGTMMGHGRYRLRLS